MLSEVERIQAIIKMANLFDPVSSVKEMRIAWNELAIRLPSSPIKDEVSRAFTGPDGFVALAAVTGVLLRYQAWYDGYLTGLAVGTCRQNQANLGDN